MPKFLFASDSLKGTISSRRAAQLLRDAALEHFPDATSAELPIADGGEGTVEAVVAATGGKLRTVRVHDPLGRPVDAVYGILPGNQAIIEMATASGLPLVAPSQRDPRITSTWGTGELIDDALNLGIRSISLAIGGSATNDGGMGCLSALGVHFLDCEDRVLTGTGRDLFQVAAIDLSSLDLRVADTRFRLMCDVDNPLLGPTGATRVFAPQKGATPQVVDELEQGMQNYARVLQRKFPDFDPMAPGMGAAGGLGAAVRAFLHAEVMSGIDCVLDLVRFDDLLQGCDLCVTGEGHADAQSAHGKVISGITARCQQAQVPCVAIVGGMDPSATELLDLGVDALVPTVIDAGGIEAALERAEDNYRLAAQRLFTLLKLGTRLE